MSADRSVLRLVTRVEINQDASLAEQLDFHSALFSISIVFQFTAKLVLATILFVLPSQPHDPYLSLGDADILNSGFKLFSEYRGCNKQALENPWRARREKAVGGAQTPFNMWT